MRLTAFRQNWRIELQQREPRKSYASSGCHEVSGMLDAHRRMVPFVAVGLPICFCLCAMPRSVVGQMLCIYIYTCIYVQHTIYTLQKIVCVWTIISLNIHILSPSLYIFISKTPKTETSGLVPKHHGLLWPEGASGKLALLAQNVRRLCRQVTFRKGRR